MKILIICNDFPPLNSIGAQRPYSWFRYFHEDGADVTIITKKWNKQSNTLLDILNVGSTGKAIEREERSEGKIIRVNNKLIPPEKLIIKYGINRYIFIRKALTFIYTMLAYVSIYFDKHYSLYAEAKKYLQNNKTDFIVATGEPFILFNYANRLKKEFNIKWIADYRDGWNSRPNRYHKKNFFIFFLKHWEWLFEKNIIKNADLITTINTQLANKLSLLHNRHVEIIYNGFDEFYQYDKISIHSNKKLVFTHSGTLLPFQRVEFLFQAIHELDEKDLINKENFEINFVGIEFFPDQLERIMTFSPRVKKYIKTTVRLPRKMAIACCAGSDYLIVFTSENDQATHAKVFDYISVKRPIIVLPDDDAVVNEIIYSLNAGKGFNDKEELKTFIIEEIKRKISDPTVVFSNVNIENAKFYTRKTQAYFFMDLLKNEFLKPRNDL